ncbi:MAG: hypothetical protein Q8736_02785, partial [Sweet potato little leaf phytoplasma]|nr:hypothetical protein [Sweet potato little leaf phytoplasma]
LINVHEGRIMMRDLNYLFLYTGREGDEIKTVKRDRFEKPEMSEEQEGSIAGTDYSDSCYVLQVPEDKGRRTIHQKSKEDPLHPGSKVRFKKKNG